MLNVLDCATSLGLDSIPEVLPNITSAIVTIVKIVIPVVLIFLGMLDMGKAVISNDEKDMKAAQGKLIKRFIYAVIIFLLVAIVQLIFGLVSKNSGEANLTACINCFVNGESCGAVAQK